MTESLLSRRRKSAMIQKQSIERLEMGSRNKTTWPCPNPWLYQEYLCCRVVPKKIAQEYGPRPFPDLKRWKDNSRQALPWSLMTERTGTRACRRLMDSIYKSPPWSQPFATRRSSPVTSRSQMPTQRMPSWSRYDLVVLEDDKQLFPPSSRGAPHERSSS